MDNASRLDALRGYLLHLAAMVDEPLALSSEEIWVMFASGYDDFTDFDRSFGEAMIWLKDKGLVDFDELPPGSNGECAVYGLRVTKQGNDVTQQAAVNKSALAKRDPLDLNAAAKLGRYIVGA